jgi:hypothetical protein
MSKSRPTASDFARSAYDPQLESGFFQRIILSNGCFKTTDAHRLDDLNIFALPYLKALPFRPLAVMDIAVSSGISTQEWYGQLRAEGIEVEVVGTDSTIDVWHIPGRIVDILLDRNMNAIHLGLLGVGMGDKKLRLLRSWGLNKFASALLKAGATTHPLRLLSKSVTEISVIEEDIEKSENLDVAQFHVIRAANILNLSYFAEDRLRQMIKILSQRLCDGGLLITCRTFGDGSNHASVFRRDGDGFAILDRLGSGSEVENLVLDTAAH